MERGPRGEDCGVQGAVLPAGVWGSAPQSPFLLNARLELPQVIRRAVRLAVGERDAVQIGAGEDAPLDVCVLEGRALQVRAGEIRAFQIGVLKDRLFEVRAGQ